MKMQEMGYDGNRLLKALQKRISRHKPEERTIDPTTRSSAKAQRQASEPAVRLRVKTSFGKK